MASRVRLGRWCWGCRRSRAARSQSIECAEKVEAIDAQHGGAAPGGTVEHADAGVF